MRIERIVDLSVPVGEDTQVYPGDPQPRLRPHSTIARDGFNLLSVALGSQTGTHVDAPFHFEPDGLRIDAMDLTLFAGTAVVLDVRGHAPRSPIGWSSVRQYAPRLRPGVIALLWTGWSAHYGSPTYLDHPYLEADACRRLLDLGVRTFCVDAINLDETPDDDHPGVGYPVHHLIASQGGVIGENFRRFEEVVFPDPFVCALPLALQGADGAPVRAVAMQVSA